MAWTKQNPRSHVTICSLSTVVSSHNIYNWSFILPHCHTWGRVATKAMAMMANWAMKSCRIYLLLNWISYCYWKAFSRKWLPFIYASMHIPYWPKQISKGHNSKFRRLEPKSNLICKVKLRASFHWNVETHEKEYFFFNERYRRMTDFLIFNSNGPDWVPDLIIYSHGTVIFSSFSRVILS